MSSTPTRINPSQGTDWGISSAPRVSGSSWTKTRACSSSSSTCSSCNNCSSNSSCCSSRSSRRPSCLCRTHCWQAYREIPTALEISDSLLATRSSTTTCSHYLAKNRIPPLTNSITPTASSRTPTPRSKVTRADSRPTSPGTPTLSCQAANITRRTAKRIIRTAPTASRTRKAQGLTKNPKKTNNRIELPWTIPSLHAHRASRSERPPSSSPPSSEAQELAQTHNAYSS